MIQSICGISSSKKGEAFCQTGKVTAVLVENSEQSQLYEAVVRDHGSCHLAVEIRRDGQIAAKCACSTQFSFDKYCKHVAASLYLIMQKHQYENETEWVDSEVSVNTAGSNGSLVQEVLQLFGPTSKIRSGSRALLEFRTELYAEFLVFIYQGGPRDNLLGIELKIGPGKGYKVPDIREFLSHYERGEHCVISRYFSYDPSQHCFAEADQEILQRLLDVRKDEKLQREAIGTLYTGEIHDVRTLPIPPSAWEEMVKSLSEAKRVQVNDSNKTHNRITYVHEPLPLQFEFDQNEQEGFRLLVKGLRDITLLEVYRMALWKGKFMKLKAEDCTRLSSLQRLLLEQNSDSIHIPPNQMEPFMERVVPGLMKLGDVRMKKAVSDRILQTPLKARIYLDRVRDKLLVSVEFQYGDIVLNPLEEERARQVERRILIREGEKESRILQLLEMEAFTKTESGFYMQDEDHEFDFLYFIVPQLEQLAQIYATSAVKERLVTNHEPPHISVNIDERSNWLEFRFQMEGIQESEIQAVLRSLEEKRKYHRLKKGGLLPLETEEFQKIIAFMNETGMASEDVNGQQFRLPAARGIHLLDARDRNGEQTIKLGKSIRRLLEHLRHPDLLDFELPPSMSSMLREYQQYGYHWLKTLAHYGFGGILADEMGLGKTIQSIAYLLSVLPEIRSQARPALIVSPASLMYNWQNELHNFAPDIRVVIADGSKKERNAVLQNIGAADVVIVSYPLLRKDSNQYAETEFHTLILDEAQAFKNNYTQTARTVKALRANFRFALTGTPVENSLEDLWSIFEAVFPGLFPDRKSYSDMSREAVSRRARPFLLRRLKKNVLRELPDKVESVQISELLPEQKKLYTAYLAKLRQETLKHLDQDDFESHRIQILAGLTRLRQICCHPALFVEGYKGSSAKMQQLLEMIDDCRNAGRRMLVFSQFTEMLNLIGRELGTRGIPFFYLDGATPAADRVELCSKFNEGQRDLFLISMKAGGTGLNLTGADTVVLYDLWWNPAVERQAEDRAHRMGQKKVVQVIRLISRGTMEDKMYELQQKKKTLLEEVIQPGEEARFSFTEEDILKLLSEE
ncbi:DEAD/DEAH box helicase [Paenibacillus lemnae]|nr:DEAD/DEAH box helicase [Paenibacillus lemnae]